MLFLGIEICKLFVRRLQKIFAQNRKIFVVRFSGLSKLVTYKKFPAQNGKIFVPCFSGLSRLGSCVDDILEPNSFFNQNITQDAF